jgi:hypothetical protein
MASADNAGTRPSKHRGSRTHLFLSQLPLSLSEPGALRK